MLCNSDSLLVYSADTTDLAWSIIALCSRFRIQPYHLFTLHIILIRITVTVTVTVTAMVTVSRSPSLIYDSIVFPPGYPAKLSPAGNGRGSNSEL